MQLQVKIKLDKPLTLPLAYHHILQSALYSLMVENGNCSLHDGGYSDEKKVFKLFTFGPISGKYSVRNGKITFFNEACFEFRCVDKKYGGAVASNIVQKGICFGENIYHDVEIHCSDVEISNQKIEVKMISPITVYGTDLGGKTTYYNPFDRSFSEAVVNNSKRKYEAYVGRPYEDEVRFEVVHVNEKDKYLTRYKGFIIEGYKGVYKIGGSETLLKLLYDAGIGSKNSQGFGMFDIIG